MLDPKAIEMVNPIQWNSQLHHSLNHTNRA